MGSLCLWLGVLGDGRCRYGRRLPLHGVGRGGVVRMLGGYDNIEEYLEVDVKKGFDADFFRGRLT